MPMSAPEIIDISRPMPLSFEANHQHYPRGRRMKLIRLCVTLLIVACPVRGFADSDEQEAIQAQLAAAMASADYAAKKCPNLQIDQAKIKALTERSGKSAQQLRASDDYAEQRDVIVSMEKSPQAALICELLPMAHNGYAAGIIK